MARRKKKAQEEPDHRRRVEIYFALFGALGGCIGMVVISKVRENFFPQYSAGTLGNLDILLSVRGGAIIGVVVGMAAFGVIKFVVKGR